MSFRRADAEGFDRWDGEVGANSLADLWEAWREDDTWEYLRADGARLVPGEGPSRPRVMLVGEAPGARENVRERPFVGPSGAVLRQLMQGVGLRSVDSDEGPANAYVTNVIKFRPPKNRTPTIGEILLAKPYLRAEWRLVGKPSVIVAVGATAWNAVGSASLSLSMMAGRMHHKADRFFWAQFHPSYGLRGGDTIKARIERDWEEMGKWLREENVC